MRYFLAVAVFMGCIAWPLAHAEPKPLWELGAGAAVASFPDYRGSSRQQNYVLPLPYVVYRGDVFQIDHDKARGLLFKTDRVELELSVNGSVPVRSSDNPVRQGMPNLDPTLELGPSLNFFLVRDPQHYELTLKLPVRAVIASDFHDAHSAGLLASPHLDLDIQMAHDWKLGLVAAALFGDHRYHDYFYAVAPQYATATRPAYEAPGGYSGMQLIAASSRRFKQFWVGGFIKYDNINHAAFLASPLVQQRSNLAAGLGVSMIFAESAERVEAGE